MRNWIFIACCLFTIQAAAQSYKPVADLNAFKQQFSKAAQSTQTIKSNFIQEKNLSMLSEKIVSKGKFWFKRENKVRMEYNSPTYYLMVINGSDFRIKDSKTDKNLSARSNKLFEQISKITADCVNGNVMNNKDFTTKVSENAQHYRLEMTPVSKTLKDFFNNIELLADKKYMSVVKIIMHEKSGDDTAISFTQKELNVTIPDDVFALK